MSEVTEVGNPANPVSPKVTIPFVVGLVVLVAQLVVTGDWSTGETFNTVVVLLEAVTGYLKTDPRRVVDY